MMHYDVIGIGCGVFNLGLAALIEESTSLNTIFFEKKSKFSWHPELMFDFARMQTHFLKDPVLLASPRSRYTFLSFLHEHGRLYQFLNTNYDTPTRREFSDYLSWVSKSLGNIQYDMAVNKIHFDKGSRNFFIEGLNNQNYIAKNIVIGAGRSIVRPAYSIFSKENHCYIANEYLTAKETIKQHQHITVVGGGQTGAEIVLDLLTSDKGNINQISWISRRYNFIALEDTPFINELYTPSYRSYFIQLPNAVRKTLLHQQKYTSDAITYDTAQAIHRELYRLKIIEKSPLSVDLMPGLSLIDVKKTAHCAKKEIELKSINDEHFLAKTDVVIAAIGLTHDILRLFDDEITNQIHYYDGNVIVNNDYSLSTNLPNTNKIYIQNNVKHKMGINDPNISLSAYRNSVIVNSLTNSRIFNVDAIDSALVSWNVGKLSYVFKKCRKDEKSHVH